MYSFFKLGFPKIFLMNSSSFMFNRYFPSILSRISFKSMKSLIAYPGGKYYMLPDILEIINSSKKTALLDVFGGSGKVLMNINEDEFIKKIFGKPNLKKEYMNYGINGRLREKTKRVELFYASPDMVK